jgi:hypothetical protein
MTIFSSLCLTLPVSSKFLFSFISPMPQNLM